MNKVSRLKVIGVARELKKGKSKQKALLANDYSESYARQGERAVVVQEALCKIMTELKASDITPEMVINRLNYDRDLAEKKGDIATMTRVDELLGKYLAMFTDKQEIQTKDMTKDAFELIRRYGTEPSQ